MPCAVRYSFSQRFPFSASKTFKWCTGYSFSDHMLMGNKKAERQITRVTETTVILTDIFAADKGDVEKQKLVQIYPERLMWISTHLTGLNKYSQFIYEVIAEGENTSRLDFTALQIEHKEMSESEVKLLAEKLRQEDSEAWHLLANAMVQEFHK